MFAFQDISQYIAEAAGDDKDSIEPAAKILANMGVSMHRASSHLMQGSVPTLNQAEEIRANCEKDVKVYELVAKVSRKMHDEMDKEIKERISKAIDKTNNGSEPTATDPDPSPGPDVSTPPTVETKPNPIPAPVNKPTSIGSKKN